MKEIINNGNIFILPKPDKRDAVCVTTNGVLCRNGKAVMGAGIAKYARDHFKDVDKILGTKIKLYGNHAHYLGVFMKPDYTANFTLLSFPTKENWKDDSSPKLICQSCKEIVVLADVHKLDTIYLPCPGCTNGHLDYWKDVRPILLEELSDDKFVVSVPDYIYKKKV